MERRLAAVFFGAATAALVHAGRASAATLCVDPQVATCHATIGAAVDAAAPGDVITIAAGVFYESVIVPAGKDRLRFVGAGQRATIVDAGPYFDLGIFDTTAPSFDISAADVQVTGLTTRNGIRGFLVRSPGALIQSVHVQSAHNHGVFVLETAAGTRVLDNRFEDCALGVMADGPDTVVRGNVMSRGDTAVEGRGARPLVEANLLDGALVAIRLRADDAVVRDNVVRNTSFAGAVQVTGRNPRIERNTLTEVDAGIVVACPQEAAPPTPPPADACATGVVSANAVTDAIDDAILVLAHAPGLRVERNRVLRSGGSISLNGVGVQALSNTITDAGRTVEISCFEAFGADHRLTENVAARCTQSGYFVNGDRVRLENNRTLGGYGDGIIVSGHNFPGGPHAGTVLQGNTANENVAYGIAIVAGAVGTTVTGNVALRNRVDFCDAGTGTVVSGNRFGSVAPCVNAGAAP
jgi:hypothetical protein